MSSILLTAYGPYDIWRTNVSQLVMEQVLANPPKGHTIRPRVYAVEFSAIHDHLSADLGPDVDFAIHLGQAPGYAVVTLEAVGINVAVERGQTEGQPLVIGGPVAYQSQLPLAGWAEGLRQLGIPAAVSYHAGTYLCNAALYLSRHETEQRRLKTQSVFLHLPMATEQVAEDRTNQPTLPLSTLSAAVGWILEQL
jgi:pyroglutamyl-peptidase